MSGRVSLRQLPKPRVEERRWEATAEVGGVDPISVMGSDPLMAIWLLCEVLAKELDDLS
jgi:hypothetical protein